MPANTDLLNEGCEDGFCGHNMKSAGSPKMVLAGDLLVPCAPVGMMRVSEWVSGSMDTMSSKWWPVSEFRNKRHVNTCRQNRIRTKEQSKNKEELHSVYCSRSLLRTPPYTHTPQNNTTHMSYQLFELNWIDQLFCQKINASFQYIFNIWRIEKQMLNQFTLKKKVLWTLKSGQSNYN